MLERLTYCALIGASGLDLRVIVTPLDSLNAKFASFPAGALIVDLFHAAVALWSWVGTLVFGPFMAITSTVSA